MYTYNAALHVKFQTKLINKFKQKIISISCLVINNLSSPIFTMYKATNSNRKIDCASPCRLYYNKRT